MRIIPLKTAWIDGGVGVEPVSFHNDDGSPKDAVMVVALQTIDEGTESPQKVCFVSAHLEVGDGYEQTSTKLGV